MTEIYHKPHEKAHLMREEQLWTGELDMLEPLPRKPRSMFKVLFTPMHVYISIVHITLIVVLGVLWSHIHSPEPAVDVLRNSWSPVQAYLEYETHHEIAPKHTASPYSRPPTAESDRAWDELVRSTYFNATREELERAGEKFQVMAELVDGGYMATLGVYHEIHCVRQLRMHLYKDRYYPDITTEQEVFLRDHIDHCIDVLLKTVMCHGNTALRSYVWDNPQSQSPSSQSSGTYRCVKWSSIQDWSRSRMVPVKPPLATPLWDETAP